MGMWYLDRELEYGDETVDHAQCQYLGTEKLSPLVCIATYSITELSPRNLPFAIKVRILV